MYCTYMYLYALIRLKEKQNITEDVLFFPSSLPITAIFYILVLFSLLPTVYFSVGEACGTCSGSQGLDFPQLVPALPCHRDPRCKQPLGDLNLCRSKRHLASHGAAPKTCPPRDGGGAGEGSKKGGEKYRDS